MDSFKQQMEDYSFTLYESSEITLQKKIGSGGTGTVYLGTLHNKECVVKKVSSIDYDEHHKNRRMYQDIIDEVDIGHRFIGKATNLIQFYGYSTFQQDGNDIIYLIMEKTNAQNDVCHYLDSSKFWNSLSKREYDTSNSMTKMYNQCSDCREYWDYILPKVNKLDLIKHMCKAVQELHSFKVVHCDLKLHNMLYTGSSIKLIDFGASTFMDNEKIQGGSVGLGTPGYMAKEMYDGWISYQADIYSLGVCMLEIWYGDIWSTDTCNYDTCRRYVLDYLILLKKENPTLHSFIQRCVSTDPKKRPLIKTVLSNLDRIHSTCIY
jgi:serine/threonine protein kinase